MNELKAARAVAEHWRRRYQAAQALIEELQGERDRWQDNYSVAFNQWTETQIRLADARRWSAAGKTAAKEYRFNLAM